MHVQLPTLDLNASIEDAADALEQYDVSACFIPDFGRVLTIDTLRLAAKQRATSVASAATIDASLWQQALDESIAPGMVTFELPPDLAKTLALSPNLCRCDGPARHLAEKAGPCPYQDGATVNC